MGSLCTRARRFRRVSCRLHCAIWGRSSQGSNDPRAASGEGVQVTKSVKDVEWHPRSKKAGPRVPAWASQTRCHDVGRGHHSAAGVPIAAAAAGHDVSVEVQVLVKFLVPIILCALYSLLSVSSLACPGDVESIESRAGLGEMR